MFQTPEQVATAVQTLIERAGRTQHAEDDFTKGRHEGYLQAIALLHGLEVRDVRKVMSLYKVGV